jgi:gluconate kinase
MEEYIKWLENKIEVCLEDKDLQREHWAFCQALKKYRELALRQPPVISSFCHHNGTYTTVTDTSGNEVCCKCKKPLAK